MERLGKIKEIAVKSLSWLDVLLFYLPQTIVFYFAIELLMLYADSDYYGELFEYLDFIDAIFCFTAFTHLCSAIYRKYPISEKYVISWATIILIVLLNVSLDLMWLNLVVYYSIYMSIIFMNFFYYLYTT